MSDTKTVKRTERGWAGHFICADRCRFRRNTLLEFGDKKVIVSTVGMMFTGRNEVEQKLDTIGAFGRYYETMAFMAKFDDPYWDIDVSKDISFESPWSINADKPKLLPHDADNRANDMHETVVAELSGYLVAGLKLEREEV